MGKADGLLLTASGDNKVYANLMAAMSILSDAQLELHTLTGVSMEGTENNQIKALQHDLTIEQVRQTINHAKAHITDAMAIIHEEHNLPGVFLTQKSNHPIEGHD